MSKRQQLDEYFPTVVRYGGILLGFVLVIATILGYGLELAAGWVFATGMIAYKSLREAARENGK